MDKKQAIKDLQVIPGIGKSLGEDLYNIGIRKVSDLKDKDPEKLYEKLNKFIGVRTDPCVLYTFRCAVYFARTPKPDPKKLLWWYWKDKKL